MRNLCLCQIVMLECLYTLKDIMISPTYYINKDTFMYFSTHDKHNLSVVQWQIRGAHLKTRDLTASQRILGGKDQVVSFLVSIRRLFHTSWPHYLRSSKKNNLRVRFEHDIGMKTLPFAR